MAKARSGESHPERIKLARRYYEFDIWLTSLINYLPANAERLQVSQGQVDDIVAFNQKWQPIYKKYSRTETHTSAAVQDTAMAFDDGNQRLHKLQQQIKHNARITLTAHDLAALQIHPINRHRKHAQHIQIAPNVLPMGIHHAVNKFHARYIGGDCEMHGRMPRYNTLLIRIAHVAADAPKPELHQYTEVQTSGSAVFNVFAPKDAKPGTRGFIVVRYVNTRNEMSPWSAPLEFIIN